MFEAIFVLSSSTRAWRVQVYCQMPFPFVNWVAAAFVSPKLVSASSGFKNYVIVQVHVVTNVFLFVCVLSVGGNCRACVPYLARCVVRSFVSVDVNGKVHCGGFGGHKIIIAWCRHTLKMAFVCGRSVLIATFLRLYVFPLACVFLR